MLYSTTAENTAAPTLPTWLIRHLSAASKSCFCLSTYPQVFGIFCVHHQSEKKEERKHQLLIST